MNNKIAVLDFETDPFEYGMEPRPFAAGFYDGESYAEFWGDDVIEQLVEFLNSLEDTYTIYAHNGGKFDFIFLLQAGVIGNPLKVIHGRIAQARLGQHTLRDSYLILPVPLSAYKKDEIDYANFTRDRREKFRADILHYLATDCEYLFEFVTAFINQYGVKLTAPSAAYANLKNIQPQKQTGFPFDEEFRPFYFGGRVEFFERGILSGDFKVFDVNSMYPYVMREFEHPHGNVFVSGKKRLPDSGPYFAHIRARSNGALPVRTKDGLSFPASNHPETFAATGHEIEAGKRLGLLKDIEVLQVHRWASSQTFSEFVDTHYQARLEAKASGDKLKDLFSKLMLNSSYGKFAMNPRNFHEYKIVWGHKHPGEGWALYMDYDEFAIWRSPAPQDRFNNVAVAASITGAARSVLMDGLANAQRTVYCDTDSIICEHLDCEQDATALGAWKLEAQADQAAIAGKKLYALFSKGEAVKLASKGVRITPDEIKAVASGDTVLWKKESPAMGLKGVRFIERNVKMR